ncbi:unnamed protein product [Prunus armeniaca]
MALSSRWKILNKELGKWRYALAKARDNHISGENLNNEVVKNCSRFRIIPTGLIVVLNETPLHDSTSSDSPLDSPMSQDLPIQKELRPIGRKTANVKRWSTSSNDTANYLEQIARNIIMRIELDMKKDADEKAMNEEYAREREYVRKKDIEKKDRETMAMDSSHMSHETKQF